MFLVEIFEKENILTLSLAKPKENVEVPRQITSGLLMETYITLLTYFVTS
jgi:hypothetical protein